ncbi:MAG TPA: PEP-CTERM sorting domain-containing protein [Candidatus Solibacter sp.]|nr:PEP-CTERM sorting domain-containing protein [Candidatus Solibacter sp.]
MRRVVGYLMAAVLIGAFGAAQPADAAAFVWMEGPNFAYSAAACATPGAAFWAWFLAVGPGATTNAWTACAGPFGSSASFAIARAGVGGAGAAWAIGIADPWAGIDVGTNLTNFSDSGDYQTDSNNAGSEFIGSGFTLTPTGINFGVNASASDLNAVDRIGAYLYTGDTSLNALCAALGGSDCSSSNSTAAGNVTDLSTLQTDLGLTLLGSVEINPNNLAGSTLNFNQTLTNEQLSQVILVGQGDAVADAPEPASMALLAVGFGALACLRRRGKGQPKATAI